jgi:hypothetical protein
MDINDNVKQAMLSKPVVDHLINYYGFKDIVELQETSVYILRVISEIEKDGYTFIIHRIKEDEQGNKVPEAMKMDIRLLIQQFRENMTNNTPFTGVVDKE